MEEEEVEEEMKGEEFGLPSKGTTRFVFVFVELCLLFCKSDSSIRWCGGVGNPSLTTLIYLFFFFFYLYFFYFSIFDTKNELMMMMIHQPNSILSFFLVRWGGVGRGLERDRHRQTQTHRKSERTSFFKICRE